MTKMGQIKKCESCGKKMPPYSDDDICEDCWEDGDDADQLMTCVICGAEVFDHHEICDGCREDEAETDF